MYVLIGMATWIVVQPEADIGARILAVMLSAFCGMAIGVTWADEAEDDEYTKIDDYRRRYTTLRKRDEEDE